MLRSLARHVGSEQSFALLRLDPLDGARGSAESVPQSVHVLLMAAVQKDPEAAVFMLMGFNAGE